MSTLDSNAIVRLLEAARSSTRGSRLRRHLAMASWASTGVFLLLAEPAIRLAFQSRERLSSLTPVQGLALALAIVAAGYFEGLRLHRSFCPGVVARAFTLRTDGSCLTWVLAPLHAMELLEAPRRRLTRNWGFVLLLSLAIGAVRHLPPLPRGIVDLSVAVSLAWGSVVLAARFVARFRAELASRP